MNVARLRKLKGWSQTDLASVVGVEQPTISRIEKGADSVTVRLMKAIADALDVPLYVLFMEERSEAELRLLEIYRSLPEDRKKGWQDMARLAIAETPREDP